MREMTADEKFRQFCGTQFQTEADRNYVPAPVTGTIYKVYVQFVEGKSVKYQGNDKAACDAAIAAIEAENAKIIARNATRKPSPWLPKPTEYVVEVIESVAVEPEIMEEVVEIVETENAAKEISEVSQSAKFVVTAKFASKADKVVYQGESKADAKAAVAQVKGKCLSVATKIDGVLMLFHAEQEGWSWSQDWQHDQDTPAGKFDAAWKRDYVNDLVLQGRDREASEQHKQWGL